MMQINRQALTVLPFGSVEIRVEFQTPSEGEEAKGAAWMFCLSCNRELAANAHRRLFECPECGYDITWMEVSALCDLHIQAVREMFGMVNPQPRRGLLWRFIRWLRGRSEEQAIS